MDGGGRRAGSNCATRGVRTSSTAHVAYFPEDDIDDNMLNGVDVTRIGVVEVRIFHATLVPTEKPPQFAVRSVNNIGSISELFKKGGLHQVSLGKATAVNANSVCIKSVVKSEDEHFASFLFQHRPAGLLQAMGIMPRLPSIEAKGGASPKETSQEISATVVKRGRHEDGEMRAPKRRRPSKDSFESEEVKPKIEDEADHDARLELLEENMRTMQAEIMSLRAAKTNSGRVKTERAPSPILGSAAGTVIDLTDN
ncbi:hypothetical protein EVG20_g4831 [Dentipellis fragilis]|uniref:DUF7918 domain-containing protein n=1 Tax=Dentipellis fragilis TaxID=205917 RepID=A0A4Y9YYQ6_9AGAM|nr:hypothetical protein EVG20_g4831 [Dentipellis fragilis]